MFYTVGILGYIGFAVFIALMVNAGLKNNGKTKIMLACALMSFCIFISGIALALPPETDTSTENNPIEKKE